MCRMPPSKSMVMGLLWSPSDEIAMADNYLERRQETYEAKKKKWEAQKRIREIRQLRAKLKGNGDKPQP